MYYLEHDMHSNSDFIIVKFQIFIFVIIRNSGSLEKLYSDFEAFHSLFILDIQCTIWNKTCIVTLIYFH